MTDTPIEQHLTAPPQGEWPEIGRRYYDHYLYSGQGDRETARVVEIADTDTMTDRVQIRVLGGWITNGRTRGAERWIKFSSLRSGYRPFPSDTEIPRGHE